MSRFMSQDKRLVAAFIHTCWLRRCNSALPVHELSDSDIDIDSDDILQVELEELLPDWIWIVDNFLFYPHEPLVGSLWVETFMVNCSSHYYWVVVVVVVKVIEPMQQVGMPWQMCWHAQGPPPRCDAFACPAEPESRVLPSQCDHSLREPCEKSIQLMQHVYDKANADHAC